MPVVLSAADVVTRKLPDVISSDAHLAADCVLALCFALAGAAFWRRAKEPALAAWVCGGSLLGLTLLTTYPGRRAKSIHFARHIDIESEMADLLAILPKILRIEKHPRRHFFTLMSATLNTVANLTDFAESD